MNHYTVNGANTSRSTVSCQVKFKDVNHNESTKVANNNNTADNSNNNRFGFRTAAAGDQSRDLEMAIHEKEKEKERDSSPHLGWHDLVSVCCFPPL